jgi:hypothetical protein
MTRIFNRSPFFLMTEAFGRVAGKSWDCYEYVYDESAENADNRLTKKKNPFFVFLQEKTVNLFVFLFLVGELLNFSGAAYSALYAYPFCNVELEGFPSESKVELKGLDYPELTNSF